MKTSIGITRLEIETAGGQVVDLHRLYYFRVTGWQPATLNELMRLRHWAQRRRRKDADANHLLVVLQNTRIPKATGKRRITVTWILGKGRKRPDEDNVWKSLLDGLVAAGALKNDSPTWCERTPLLFERGPKSGLAIAFEDIP